MKLTGIGKEAKYAIHYTNLPVNYDTTMIVLDTDYDNYAVIWSCNGIGPVGHTGLTKKNLPTAQIFTSTDHISHRISMVNDERTTTTGSNITASLWHLGQI